MWYPTFGMDQSPSNQVLVNVGRAGAANLDVIQEVEYVKQEAKIVYLLECLQKTAPPVCIFCEKKQASGTVWYGIVWYCSLVQ